MHGAGGAVEAERPAMLSVTGVHKKFGGLNVLSDIHFDVRSNVTLGLIGPNGAGKTTLFNILSGFLRPDRGSITFAGRDVTRLSPERRSRLGLARTFQVVKPFLRLSTLDNIMVGAFAGERTIASARKVAAAALERVGLGASRDIPAGSLTLPDRKRMELARCLATRPQLLLLDEVMCGLNPSEMDDLIVLIRSLRGDGITVILVEHIMDAVAELADEIIVLTSGRILAQGAPESVLRNPDVVAAYLGEAHHVAY
jgi:branched-chain amino acid transport system ATP-binding protein